MIKSYQYRFYPNKEQKRLIDRTLECCDFMVDYCLNVLETKKDNYDEIDMMLEFAFYKMRTSNYSDICDEPVNDRMKKLYKLYKKVKNRDDCFEIMNKKMKGFNHFFVNHCMGDVVYKENYIHTSFLGNLKIKGGQRLTGDVLFYTIEKRSTDKYFISLCCKNIEDKEFTKTNKAIGLDMGLNHFLTMSNGVKIGNPRFLEKARKIIKKNQRKLARKEKILCINYLIKSLKNMILFV